MQQNAIDNKSTWLGAVQQQAIYWAYVDPELCLHMASLGHNQLIIYVLNCSE